MLRLLRLILTVALLVTIVPPASADAAGASDAAGSHRWRPWNMSTKHDYTAQQAAEVASRTDVVTSIPWPFRQHADTMRAVNPSIELWTYINAAYVRPNDVRTHPDAWYARDATGSKIRSNGFGNYLMDISNPAWVAHVVALCAVDVARSNSDGCYMDMLTVAPVNPRYGTGVPVDPRTGVAWTKEQWFAMTTHLAEAVAVGNPGLTVSGNALHNGVNYFADVDAYRRMARAMDAVHSEDWMRGSGDAATRLPDEDHWRKNVDMIVDIEAQGGRAMVTTKLWSAATPAQVTQWHKLSMASFLLAASPRSTFGFTSAQNVPGASGTNLAHDVPRDLGAATGPYTMADGVARREYANGLVLVNPTDAPRTVRLAHEYTTLDGDVVRSLTLAPSSGEVLRFHAPGRSAHELVTVDATGVERVAGADRVGTAVAVAREAFPTADTAVVVATSSESDALVAGPLATALGGPLLLSRAGALDAGVTTTLRELGVERVVVVATGAAAAAPMIADLQADLAVDVEVVGGDDPYATAAAVARRVVELTGTPVGAVLASGENLADAVGGGALAATSSRVLLLTPGDSLAGPARQVVLDLGLGDVLVAGGPAAISQDVLDEVRRVAPRVERLGGATRYDTAVAMARRVRAELPAQHAGFLLVTGRTTADALTVAPTLRGSGRVVLLADAGATAAAGDLLASLLADVSQVRVIGGEVAVPSGVVRDVLAAR